MAESDAMRRRALLVAVAGLPGCTEPSASGPTPTATPPVESGVDPVACPDRPSTLTASSVATFVHQFERAYVARRVLARVERVTSFEFLSFGVESVTETGDGYRVEVGGFYGYAYYDDATAVATTHADSGTYRATYLVTERAVFRVEHDEDDAVDPRTDGERVRCPPGG